MAVRDPRGADWQAVQVELTKQQIVHWLALVSMVVSAPLVALFGLTADWTAELFAALFFAGGVVFYRWTPAALRFSDKDVPR